MRIKVDILIIMLIKVGMMRNGILELIMRKTRDLVIKRKSVKMILRNRSQLRNQSQLTKDRSHLLCMRKVRELRRGSHHLSIKVVHQEILPLMMPKRHLNHQERTVMIPVHQHPDRIKKVRIPRLTHHPHRRKATHSPHQLRTKTTTTTTQIHPNHP